MSDAVRHDGGTRHLLRQAYSTALLLQTYVAHGLPTWRRTKTARVYYGGARAGDVGGPLVKVQRLRQHFPEHRWTYNLVYSLSNAPYLPLSALQLLQRRGVPIVHNQNGVFYPGWYGTGWEAQNARMAHAYGLADHVFWQSDFCRRAATEFLGERQGPGEVLFNALDIDHFSPAGKRADPARPFTFLATGKFDSHLLYRLDSSLRGLAVARRQGVEAELQIAGWIDPDTASEVRALADHLDIAAYVKLLGAYTQADAPALYRNADACLMLKFNDPCPNTVLEAMACGLPVLYSASGGVPELVGADAGVGLPVPADWEHIQVPHPRAIAEGMARLIVSHASMGAAARQRAVEQFDIRRWVVRHRAVFEQLLAART